MRTSAPAAVETDTTRMTDRILPSDPTDHSPHTTAATLPRLIHTARRWTRRNLLHHSLTARKASLTNTPHIVLMVRTRTGPVDSRITRMNDLEGMTGPTLLTISGATITGIAAAVTLSLAETTLT